MNRSTFPTPEGPTSSTRYPIWKSRLLTRIVRGDVASSFGAGAGLGVAAKSSCDASSLPEGVGPAGDCVGADGPVARVGPIGEDGVRVSETNSSFALG